MSNDKLDRGWSAHWGDAIFNKDMIVWEGEPKFKSRMPYLSLFF
jgi:hypothetical protein